jgi:hypothetical protein
VKRIKNDHCPTPTRGGWVCLWLTPAIDAVSKLEQRGTDLKRPQQHITDSQGNALFRQVFAEWAVNPSEEDYGWDYIVERFKGGISTGLLFSAQLKSSANTQYSCDGSFISQPLERKAAEYLARQLQIPSFLFHADVTRGKLFWNAIQLDEPIRAALERSERDQVTVRIRTSNVLPDAFDRFVSDLTASQNAIVRRVLRGTNAADFFARGPQQPSERIREEAQDFHEKGFFLELSSADELRKRADFPGAIAAIQRVLEKSDGHTYIQFNGTLRLGEFQGVELMRSDQPQSFVANHKLANAKKLCGIAKRIPRHLHLIAQILRRSAELGVAVHRTFELLMSWYAHSRSGRDPIWVAVLASKVNESLLETHKRYRRALRIAGATSKSRYRWITPLPVIEIATEVTKLATSLESTGFTDAARYYDSASLDLLKFAAAIATENGNIDELFKAAVSARMVGPRGSGEGLRWARSLVETWPEDSEYRRTAEELFSRSMQRQKGEQFENDIQTTPRQIHHNLLTAHGIDPTAAPWPKLIELAIRDDDPTRVLKECTQKFVSPHPIRDIALDRLGLNRANPKIIYCALHRYAATGEELDGINDRFNANYCSKCADKVARPNGWSYYDDDEVIHARPPV